MADGPGFWDKRARRYAADPIKDVASYERTLERTRAHLGARDRVLELGCGTGTTALRLTEAVGELIATDISAEMVAIAREKAAAEGVRNVAFRQADIPGALGADGAWDAILAFNLFHLLPDLDADLARIAGALRPGGRFVSKTVCLKGAGLHLRVLVPVMRAVGQAPCVRFLATAELDAAIARAGFEIVETADMPVRPPSHFVVARKP